jgi:Protein kinase domain/MORN repeat
MVTGRCRYEGEWSDGRFDGPGTFLDEDRGVQYVGSYERGLYHGQGALITRQGRYDGPFQAGKMHGAGTLFTYKDGAHYFEGSWSNGKKDGWFLVVDWLGRRMRRKFESDNVRESHAIEGDDEPTTAFPREFTSFVKTPRADTENPPSRPSSSLGALNDCLSTGSASLSSTHAVAASLPTLSSHQGAEADGRSLSLSYTTASDRTSGELGEVALKFDEASLDLGRSLGAGSFGRVLCVSHRVTGGSYAAKMFYGQDAFEAEVSVFRKLQAAGAGWHRNVVKMVGTGLLPGGPLLVMPLFDESLWTFVAKRQTDVLDRIVDWFSERQLAGFCANILRGLAFLHAREIAHRE